MAETRAGRAREKWAAELRADIEDIAEHLGRGLDLMRQLEPETKGLNGLPGLLRNKGTEIETTIKLLTEEGEKIASRVPALPPAPPEISEAVDHELAAEVGAAR